ncbi:MAG: hypothetical protein SOI62_00860 [Lactobacillus sp.]|jgi:hypothetical protein
MLERGSDMRNSLNRILSNKLTQCAVTFIFIFFSGSLAFAAIADVKLLDRSPWTDILWAAAAFLIGVVNMSLLIHTVEEDARKSASTAKKTAGKRRQVIAREN